MLRVHEICIIFLESVFNHREILTVYHGRLSATAAGWKGPDLSSLADDSSEFRTGWTATQSDWFCIYSFGNLMRKAPRI